MENIEIQGTEKQFEGHTVCNAYEVCVVLNTDADIADASNAPTWDLSAFDDRVDAARRSYTLWSWDADGAVVGGDGSYNDEAFRYMSWSDLGGR